MKTNRVMVITGKNCPGCESLKRKLKDLKIDFEEGMVSWAKSIPQLLIDGSTVTYNGKPLPGDIPKGVLKEILSKNGLLN